MNISINTLKPWDWTGFEPGTPTILAESPNFYIPPSLNHLSLESPRLLPWQWFTAPNLIGNEHIDQLKTYGWSYRLEPGTLAILVRSFINELPRPISTVQSQLLARVFQKPKKLRLDHGPHGPYSPNYYIH